MRLTKEKKAIIEARGKRESEMYARRGIAGRAVNKAVKEGVLPAPASLKCFDCGRQAQCYDHRDYRRPLHVWPVCKSCDCKRGAAEPYDGDSIFWMERMLETKRRLAGINPPFMFESEQIPPDVITKSPYSSNSLHDMRAVTRRMKILSLERNGVSRKEISKLFKISLQRVSQIIKAAAKYEAKLIAKEFK